MNSVLSATLIGKKALQVQQDARPEAEKSPAAKPMRSLHHAATQPASFSELPALTWLDAAYYPLCLLDPSMQNRRIIEGAFRSCGISSHVVFEANDLSAVVGAVKQDCGAAILPEAWLSQIGLPEGVLAARLVNPVLSPQIGWVIAEREPFSPLASAMMQYSHQFEGF